MGARSAAPDRAIWRGPVSAAFLDGKGEPYIPVTGRRMLMRDDAVGLEEDGHDGE
jgi:hypothetical protein